MPDDLRNIDFDNPTLNDLINIATAFLIVQIDRFGQDKLTKGELMLQIMLAWHEENTWARHVDEGRATVTPVTQDVRVALEVVEGEGEGTL